MATKTISTWDEFKTAWTESISETTTYIITNDIDVSDTPIDTTLNCPGQSWSTHYVKIFTTNGDNVNIIGLTKYNSGTLLNISGEYGIVVFNKINFINCQITQGCLFGVSSYNRAISVVNAVITGYVYMFNTRTLSSGIVFFYYKNCAVNTKGYRSIGDYSIVVECWIHFDGIGTNSSSLAIVQWGKIAQSYYEGAISVSSGSFINTATIYNNVFNLSARGYDSSVAFFSSPKSDIEAISLITSYSGVYTAPYGNSTNLINNDKVTNYVINTNYLIPLTDAQIKSVSAINELAPNFPISL